MENNYEEIILKMLSEMFREKWMDDDYWNLFISEIRKEVDFNWIENNLKIGESNGFSIEEQKQMMRKLFKN